MVVAVGIVKGGHVWKYSEGKANSINGDQKY